MKTDMAHRNPQQQPKQQQKPAQEQLAKQVEAGHSHDQNNTQENNTMTTDTKLKELADCMKAMLKERGRLERFNALSVNEAVTRTRRHNAMADARGAAIEIRRLMHEAHCLAVEIGIADMRDPEHYKDSTAPAGCGRYVIFHKRAPEVLA